LGNITTTTNDRRWFLEPYHHFIISPQTLFQYSTMSLTIPTGTRPLATAAVAPPSLLYQVGMAGTAAVITVSFIHPIDVVKVR
jgi:hypothetical protein